jgi:F-type H+-transporting ATPase subunit epsilon
MTIQCDIVTQERTVFSEQVDFVSLPAAEGVMGILPNHAPLLTSLRFGEVMVRRERDEQFFAIGGGFAEIQPDHVIILADSAEHAEEIDIERAEQARQKAEELMEEGVSVDSARYAQIDAALKRAQIRIDVSMKRAGRQPRRRREMAGFRREEEEES